MKNNDCFVCGKDNDSHGNNQRVVVLKFYRENLDYSIGNMAYVESHVMGDESECRKHMVADILEPGNRDRVTRLLEVIYSGVVEMLYPYTKTTHDDDEITDDLWNPSEYRIEMRVPKTFSTTTLRLLNNLIHEYMVYRVLHDWLTVTGEPNSNAAQHWLEKAAEAEKEIERVKNNRTTGSLRRPMSPW